MIQAPQLSAKTKKALSKLKAVIFDVDDTLVFAKSATFYMKFSEQVHKAVMEYFGISDEQAQEILSFYRKNYDGGEQALFMGNAHKHFPNLKPKKPNCELLYDLLIQINPEGAFHQQKNLQKHISKLRSYGIKIVALTSSPDQLSQKILKESGYSPETDFDLFIGYNRDIGPPKKMKHVKIFSQIAHDLNISTHEIISIGDSLSQDVMPAIEAGMMGCLISNSNTQSLTEITTRKTSEIIVEIINAKTKDIYE